MMSKYIKPWNPSPFAGLQTNTLTGRLRLPNGRLFPLWLQLADNTALDGLTVQPLYLQDTLRAVAPYRWPALLQ